jgi:hypothetical protein
MFYQVAIGVTGISTSLDSNKTKEEVLSQYVCPFISKEIRIEEGAIINMASFGSLSIYRTARPIDSDWPLPRPADAKADSTKEYLHDTKVREYLREHEANVTDEFYREAIAWIRDGTFKESMRKMEESLFGRQVFMITPIGVADVDDCYEFAVKPAVTAQGFEIRRSTDLSTTEEITQEILDHIATARFVVADLTDNRPNCYYEAGYAQARGKPVIILAKEGTKRHFDVSVRKWTYWSDFRDLKTKFEAELTGVLASRQLR